MKSTTTKKKSAETIAAPRNPFDLSGMVDKSAVADELAFIPSCDPYEVTISFHADNVLYDGSKVIEGTAGHVFQVDLDPNVAQVWIDDRQGDLRIQLAEALELRATALATMAEEYRRHV